MRKLWSLGICGMVVMFMVIGLWNTAGYVSAEPALTGIQQRPLNLPASFPVPDDALTVTAVQNSSDEEKFVLFTFQTRLSMETLAKTYSEYFREHDMKDAIDMLSEQKMVIQGTNEVSRQSWILTAVPAADTNDRVEMTVVWTDER
ncbi:hypothetical protein [Paenibacillus shenyangensis]|uniref:hypothetical protein n=1 Tax=Paenibacillus sp. A9 TaxID=1284352 RepID=UPI000361D59A|nr:hypothetical protein [Paenibacillus sp. A9]